MTIDARNRISRRTLAAGAAWAVPAVALVAAAPHVSASGEIVVSITSACKSPGESTVCGKSYLFADVVVTSHISQTATVKFTSVTSNPDPGLYNCSSSQQVSSYLIVNQTFTLAGGAQKTFTAQQCSTSSANIKNVTFRICWAWTIDGGVTWHEECQDFYVKNTPPDCSATLCP